MAVLVLRRPLNGRAPLPYDRWLRDLEEEIVLFALAPDESDDAFAHVEYFESFDDAGVVEARAVALDRTFSFSAVFAQSEHDVLRAARLRELLGVSGQSGESAAAYRDKVVMKTLARRGGVRTADFAPLRSPDDLRRFAREHGYPCVVKPRAGAGARGVRVLRTADAVDAFLRHPLPGDYMVETFVDGPVCHVDGLATDGRVLFASPARYVNNCLAYQTGQSLGNTLLDPEEDLSRRLIAVTKRLIAALPTAPHIAFHAELFVDADGGVVLCEVACRPGGGRITDMIEQVYGVDLYEQWVRRSFGLPIDLPLPRRWTGAGILLVPPRKGTLRAMPDSVPFGWVVDYRRTARCGTSYDDPSFCTEHIVSFIVSGADSREVEVRIRALDQWFRDHVEWHDSAACGFTMEPLGR